MKPTAVLVNTSRGPVVDQAALADALRDGVIWAAGLDVTDPEPIPMDDPLVGLDNCLIVPHIASASRATRGKMAAMAAANLHRRRARRAAADRGAAAGLTDRAHRIKAPRNRRTGRDTVPCGPVAQWQSRGLLILWSWVRIPPGSPIRRDDDAVGLAPERPQSRHCPGRAIGPALSRQIGVGSPVGADAQRGARTVQG